MSEQDFNIEEGSVTFWIESNKLNYSDGKSTILLNNSNKDGSIFIVKDKDNSLKFFHVYYGFGRTNVEIDVSRLNSNEKHFIGATWNIKEKKIVLYLDDKNSAESLIKY